MTETARSPGAWLCFSQRATDVYAIVMLAFFPLFTGTSGYVFLHLKKYLFFLAATVLWLLSLFFFRVIWPRGSGRGFKPSFPGCCMLAFALFGSLSTLLSPYAVFFTTEIGKYDGMLTYLLYMCVLGGVFRFGADRRHCMIAFSVGYTLCCAVAAVQLLGFNALWLFPDDMTYYSPYVQETGAFLGTLGNVDVFSALHCLALPLFAGVLLMGRGRLRFLLLIPLLLGAAVMLCAKVASGLLALCVTTALLIPALFAARLRSRGRAVGKWASFSGFLIILIGLLILYFLPVRSGAVYELRQVLHGNVDDSFGSHRILIWRKTAEVFRSHFLLGIGPDCLEYYLDILFERESEVLGQVMRSIVDNAHNMYLQLFVNFGVIGAVPLSILAVYTAERIAARMQSIRLLLAPMICFLIQAAFNIGTCIIAPLFLILWGLVLHDARERETSGESSPDTREEKENVCT